MSYAYQAVAQARIAHEDQTFRITLRRPNDALKRSIRTVGLINPPIVRTQNDQFIVVSGFARVDACRSLQWPEIPVRVLPTETAFAQCALIAVSDNAALRELNVVEMARALDLLTRAATDTHERVRLMESIGLAANPQLLDKLGQVTQMSDHLQQGLCDGTIALPMALRLHALDDRRAAEQLGILFIELEWSLSRQREFLDWVQAIAQREGVEMLEVVNDPQLMLWRQDTEMDRGHKSQLIRMHIKKRRYPSITAFETHYSQTVKSLQISQGAQLIPPPHFEGQTYSLKLDFKNQDELEKRSREVQRLVNSPILKKLLLG
jgi:ParB family transcriptional regulator, chromosome partitioning protein